MLGQQVPIQQGLASGEGLWSVLDSMHRHIVGDLANDRIPDEVTNLCCRHTSLRELSRVGFTLRGQYEALEDTRIGDGGQGHGDGVGNHIRNTIQVPIHTVSIWQKRI